MNLGLLNEVINSVKESKLVQNFIKELSNYLNNSREGVGYNMENQIQDELREENVLYQVVDKGLNGFFLQNTKNNKVFEENNIQKELQNQIQNDTILRYKNGEYILEKELTDEFLNNMVSSKEYQEIQEKFIKESNITEINPDTRFNVAFREKDFSILNYENNTIKVPNVLLPYFIYSDTILKYENGKFEKDVHTNLDKLKKTYNEE